MVLSGMNTQDQLSQNIETAESALPGSLEGAEADAVEKAREHIAQNYRPLCRCHGARRSRLIVLVHVVVLNLAEIPAEGIEQRRKISLGGRKSP